MSYQTPPNEQRGIIMSAKESASSAVTRPEPQASEAMLNNAEPLATKVNTAAFAVAEPQANAVNMDAKDPIEQNAGGPEEAVVDTDTDTDTVMEGNAEPAALQELTIQEEIASQQPAPETRVPEVTVPEVTVQENIVQERAVEMPPANAVIAEAETAKLAHSLKKTKAAKKSRRAPKPKPLTCVINQQWQSMHEQVAGRSHRNALQPMPCQDVAFSAIQPRPILLLADGAGSAAVSEQGAQTLVSGIARLLNTLEQQVATLLDKPGSSAEEARQFCLLLIKHGIGLLTDKAAEQRRSVKDFNATFLVAVLGKAHWLWLRVGDGALVMETMTADSNANAGTDGRVQLTPQLSVLGCSGKGEFANQTTFVNAHLQPHQVQSGFMPIAGLTGLALMSGRTPSGQRW